MMTGSESSGPSDHPIPVILSQRTPCPLRVCVLRLPSDLSRFRPFALSHSRFYCVLLCAALTAAGCRGRVTPQPAGGPKARAVERALFTDVAAAAGVTFRHEVGGTSPLTILQTAGAGCGVLDYNGDGRLDLFLVNGMFLDGRSSDQQPRHALYRNEGGWRFTDVTAKAGVGGPAYGMGAAVGDYDGDGRPDLYVTAYGGNTLYRNNGDGSFRDVTARAGVRTGGWSTSAGWADYDGDGDLDLYVGRYLQFDRRSKQFCPVGAVPLACPPRFYPGAVGVLYRNNGDGTFTDVTAPSGAVNRQGKTLGVLWWDENDDGRPDLYVANDGVANSLFQNVGGGRFRNEALAKGLAYGATGSAEASMGVDIGDYDGDGRFDLFVTNFQNETHALYHNDGASGYTYATSDVGLAEVTLPFLSFGCGFLDWDNDGWQDLFTVSGHVQDRVREVDASCTYAQQRQLFRNRGDSTFEDVSTRGGPALTTPAVGRGAAFGDLDGDGDVDVLVNNCGGPAMLLRNELPAGHHWLAVRLDGAPPNRFGIGARVSVTAGGRTQIAEACAGHSYASTSEPRLQFGLGAAARVDRLTVRWPRGTVTTLSELKTDREVVVRESRR
jgi:enediyne biosynthesis protein E4